MKWRDLWVLPLFLSCAAGSAYGQDVGNVVSFSSKAYAPSIGTYAEFAFGWGNGTVVSAMGDSVPLVFDSKMYKIEGPEISCLQTKPFVVDEGTGSVNFTLAYRFLVEARKRSVEPMDQGLMELDLVLYDLKSGKVQTRRTALAERYLIDVAPGKDYEGSGFDEVSISVDPEWVSSGPREVVLRVAFIMIPYDLVKEINGSISDSFPESLSNHSLQ